MTSPLSTWKPAMLRLWLASMFLSLSFTVLLSLWGRALIHSGAPHGIVSFELAWSPERLAKILDGWNKESLRAARRITIVDFAFILSYWGALTGGALLVGGRLGGLGAGAVRTAAGLDIVENFAGLLILNGSGASSLIWTMSTAAAIKFALIGAVILLILFGAARLLLPKSPKKKSLTRG